jgi:PAS domain S-box-containing protein
MISAAYFHAYGLAFLELTFILVAFMLLHGLKPVLGAGPFYVAVGTTIVFSQLVSASGMRIVDGIPGMDVEIGTAIFFTPLMAALLITYITDGTVEAQRLIAAIVGVAAIFIYLSFLSEKQAQIPGYQVLPGVPSGMLQPILSSGRKFMLAALLSILIEFLVLPILYELLRHRDFSLGVSVFGALLATQVLDTFFYELVTNFNANAEEWWDALRSSYLSRAGAMIWIASLTTLYLRQRDGAEERKRDKRRPLDIISAFVGAYGITSRRQANVRDWEGRYRLVVENTSDLILLVDQNGAVLDANKRTMERSGYALTALSKMSITTLMHPEDKATEWVEIWNRLHADGSEQDTESYFMGHEWVLKTRDNNLAMLDITFTAIHLRNRPAVLIAARDISRRRELERERELLREKFVQLERMDAVGKLAGGIAHDFNNLLHAIQGSLDVLDQITDEEKSKRLISNINTATERASALTGQLLGYARGGKYEVITINVAELIGETENLFRPMLGKDAKLKVALHPDPMTFQGDFNQLEHVVLNLLLNALEALEGEPGRIVLRAEPATEFTPGWRTELGGSFVVIRVRDNGCGMDEETRDHIFEPFYTTKEAKGTGMGLAMAYGCAENHHGWLHVESTLGKGTEFFIFLPIEA